MATGTLYLLPTWLGEQQPNRLFPPFNLEVMDGLKNLVVENERTARRFLRSWGYKGSFDDLNLIHADKDTERDAIPQPIELLIMGHHVGLMSEAGCPGVADPGSLLIAKAQEMGIKVVPLVGPSSILMGLMASGLNGQQFTFHGYLPIDRNARHKALRDISGTAARTGFTQIFMETPYRNAALLDEVFKACPPSLRLCLAIDVTLPTEQIITRTIGEWKTGRPKLDKRPCMFLLGV